MKSGTRKTADQILDEALASIENLPGAEAPVAPAADLEGEVPAGLEEAEGLDLEGLDEGDGEGAGLGEGEEGEIALDEGEGEDSSFPSDEGDVGAEPAAELEGEGEGEFEEADAFDPEAPIVAFASIEQELDEVSAAQGLDRIPQGVTASGEDLVDYLLATGAIIELKIPSIKSEERGQREQAFASIDDSEFYATADELGEIGADLTGEEEPALEPEGDEGLEPEGEEAGELALEGDLDLSEEEPVAEEPAAPAAEPAAEPAEGEACVASTELRFHPVADQELIATASAGDVQLVFANTGANPRYNVIIAGVPAAVITWEGVRAATPGISAEAIASFRTDDYRRNTLEVMASQGVGRVLEDLGAEFYANAYTHSDLATQIQASVHQEVGAEYQNRVVAMREELLDLGNLALAGYSKGYFKGENPLHAHAVRVLAAAGVMNAEAVALDIASAAPAAFDLAMAKAVEFMDRSPDFVAQTREAIDEVSPRLRVEASAPAASSLTLAQRLGSQALAAAAPVTQPSVALAGTRGVDSVKASFEARIGKLGKRH